MIDLDKLRLIYNLGKKLTFSDAQELLNNAKTKSFAVGELLIKEGQTIKQVFFIRKGLVRGVRINDRGEEITTMLRWENQPVASPNLILFNEAARQNFEAIEPTDVFYMDYDHMESILSRNPKLEANRKYFLQNVLKEALERIDSFILLSPEERYVDFVKTKPDIVDRIPGKYIASLLGITPVSLSRIRKRIASRKR